MDRYSSLVICAIRKPSCNNLSSSPAIEKFPFKDTVCRIGISHPVTEDGSFANFPSFFAQPRDLGFLQAIL